MLNLYPWQMTHWQQLVTAHQLNRLPHALLISGPKGIGKEEFATNLTNTLLCESVEEHFEPCGNCKACHLLSAESHPDIKFITPEDDGKQIKVEQIRNIIEFLTLKSHYGRYKILIIQPAENMNRNAANTLLKTLEEPPEKSLIILLSDRIDLLPVTIRSRCQKIMFNPAYDETAIEWLKDKVNHAEDIERLLVLANGAPLEAIRLDKEGTMEKQEEVINELVLLHQNKADPVNIARRWVEMGTIQVLGWILDALSQTAKNLSLDRPSKGVPGDRYLYLQDSVNRLDLQKVIQCYDLALKNYKLAIGNVSYNQQGLLEDFIIFWQQINRTEGGI